MITQENIELGVALVRKSAIEEAVREIDSNMEASMEEKRKARETGQPYIPRYLPLTAPPWCGAQGRAH